VNTEDFEVLLGLRLSTKHLRLEYTPRAHEVHPEIRKAVAAAWARRQTRSHGAIRSVQEVFPLYRYEGYHETFDTVTIFLGRTDYRETYGTNIANPQLAMQHGKESLGNALAVCGLVLGADNSILLLKRSENVDEKPTWWHTIGGHLERSKLQVLRHPDAALLLQHEIEEELSHARLQILGLLPICLIRPLASHKTELCYVVNTDLPLHMNPKLKLNFEHSDYTVLPCTLASITAWLEQHWDRTVAGTKAALYHLCLLRFNRAAVHAAWNTSPTEVTECGV
jgi:hypothetical protein